MEIMTESEKNLSSDLSVVSNAEKFKCVVFEVWLCPPNSTDVLLLLG